MVSTGNSVRHRVLRHALAKIKQTDLPSLGPGEMQLYSYFTPGLSTGDYDIIVKQTITADEIIDILFWSVTTKSSKIIDIPFQSFSVSAPKFSIDPTLIHSTFPHEGVAAQANILPHVVFNDPHLPWQTEIGMTSEEDTLRIPWLAVVAFEQSELKLPPDDPLFPPRLQGDKSLPQSFTMATRLTVGKLTGSGLQCALPALNNDLLDDPTLPSKPIDVIFPKMDLFLALFGSNTSGAPPKIDLNRFKYLAHARQVNTTHMTDSGVLDEGQFSIVFSHRTGPPFEQRAPAQPKRCVVHLVSLDWIHRIPASALTSNKRAALISLFSWTYDCIPPGTITFGEVMKTVGQNSGLYRTPDTIRNRMSNNRMKDRLGDGYTLVRYRVQTGEESVALMRGPLAPYTDPDTTWMGVHSNTGEDLKIIDTELGIIDISYCAAWQLGKSLAMADQGFCAALFRIRADAHDTASKRAKEDALSQNIEAITSERVIGSLPQHFADMKQLFKKRPNRRRWDRPFLIQSSYQHLAKKDPGSVESHLRRRVGQLALATDGSHYTELKDPISTDWDLVLNWIVDKLYLERIPPWYLIPDPSWLPAESIRFFYIDRKWLSALVDGALSVANHLDAQDKVRQAIKDQLLKYLNEDIHPNLKHPPQIPSYGFYMRSVVVDALPDLIVRAPRPTLDDGKEDPRAEILRQENIRKDIIFCLLDYIPEQLILSQPPHQQCFMFGHASTFTTDSFELELRKVYSVRTDKHMNELPKESFSKGLDGRCEIYDWNTRTILVDKFVDLVFRTLHDAHQRDSAIYDEEVNASLVGIELNSAAYRLTFTSGQPPEATGAHSVTPTEVEIEAEIESEIEAEIESEIDEAEAEIESEIDGGPPTYDPFLATIAFQTYVPRSLATVPTSFRRPVEATFASSSPPTSGFRAGAPPASRSRAGAPLVSRPRAAASRSRVGALPASGSSAETAAASRSRAGAPPASRFLAGAPLVSRPQAGAPPVSRSRAGAPPASLSSAEAATASNFPIGVAGAVAPGKSYDRPFKGVPPPRNVPHGPPRRSGFPPPALATPRTDKPTKPSRESATMSASISQFSIAPEISFILSRISYDGKVKCSSRFSPICFPIGGPSMAKDDEPKYLIPSPNGSDVIVRLARNQSDPNSTDHIRIFEIRIPFGTTVHSLLTKPLDEDAVQMLNTVSDVGIIAALA
ncbi:hypothetical protein APHAL10511_002208 [Amanita phalloides]|nr:hypothetical protein APHAL10511_002208 [Amanita phalloides]